MSSITRDTYAPGLSFSAAEIAAVASGIGAALEHLHARGLSHGDVYAHNILWRQAGAAGAAGKGGGRKRKHPHQPEGGDDNEGEVGGGQQATARLSDFGAAFYYGGLPSDTARARYAQARSVQARSAGAMRSRLASLQANLKQTLPHVPTLTFSPLPIPSCHPPLASFERMEQRAYGFLLEELLERHNGMEPARLLAPVRAAAAAATSARPEDRPGFTALLKMLGEKGRRLGRPRSNFGRVLPHDSPLKE